MLRAERFTGALPEVRRLKARALRQFWATHQSDSLQENFASFMHEMYQNKV
jgi:hypothetical protein